MDAREKLRRYLEQRREMGETELVLDSMSIDEALRIVSGSTARASSSGSSILESDASSNAQASVREERADRTDLPESADWRAALRATGAGPESAARRAASRPDAAG